MEGLWNILCRISVIGVLAHPAFNILILLSLLVWAAQRKDPKLLTVCIPVLPSLIIIILGSSAGNGARYCFPIIYTMPVLLGYANSGGTWSGLYDSAENEANLKEEKESQAKTP